MEKKPVIYVVGTECDADLEEKFNTWYNGTHIPLLLKSKKLESVTRYEITPIAEGPKYLAIYEYKDQKAFKEWESSPEMLAARKERMATWADRDFRIKWRAVYQPFKTWTQK